jgi:hypothetical protein
MAFVRWPPAHVPRPGGGSHLLDHAPSPPPGVPLGRESNASPQPSARQGAGERDDPGTADVTGRTRGATTSSAALLGGGYRLERRLSASTGCAVGSSGVWRHAANSQPQPILPRSRTGAAPSGARSTGRTRWRRWPRSCSPRGRRRGHGPVRAVRRGRSRSRRPSPSRSVTPSGSGPRVRPRPSGAPTSATVEPGLMPSSFGSGVPE